MKDYAFPVFNKSTLLGEHVKGTVDRRPSDTENFGEPGNGAGKQKFPFSAGGVFQKTQELFAGFAFRKRRKFPVQEPDLPGQQPRIGKGKIRRLGEGLLDQLFRENRKAGAFLRNDMRRIVFVLGEKRRHAENVALLELVDDGAMPFGIEPKDRNAALQNDDQAPPKIFFRKDDITFLQERSSQSPPENHFSKSVGGKAEKSSFP